MTHDEFVGQVQARAHLPSRGAAEAAIRATLETLAERLEGGAADNLAAQLPREIGRHLTTDHSFQRLSIDEFFRRVCELEGEGFDLPDSVYHARVVIEVLEEAVSKGAVDKIRAMLPAEYAPLFEAGSQGRMREAKDQKGDAPRNR
jgi:uncharacterized protein (DUF2267 family)